MSDLLYIAPASATAVVLFDCVDADGSSNPETLTTKLTLFDPGFPRKEPVLSGTSGTPGQSIVTRSDMGPVTGQIQMKSTAANRDAYEGAVSALGQILQRSDLVLVRRFEGETTTRYYAILSADLDAPLGDALGMDLVLTRNTQIALTIDFIRKPLVMGDQLDPDVQKMTNPTMLYVNGSGVPLGWALSLGAGNTYAKPNPDLDCWEVDNASASAITTLIQDVAVNVGETWSAAVDAWDYGAGTKTHLTFAFMNAAKSSTLYTSGLIDAANTDWGPTTQRRGASRLSHSHTAPASSAWLRVTLTVDAAGKGRFRFAQSELAAAATEFRMGAQAWTHNPTDLTSQPRSALIYNPSDGYTPVTCKTTMGASSSVLAVASFLRSGIRQPENTITYRNRAQLATLINRALYIQLSGGTLSNSTTLHTPAPSSTNNATADVGFGSGSGPAPMLRRVRVAITDVAILAALRGSYTAMLRFTPTDVAALRIRGLYAAGNVQPATQLMGEVRRAFTNPSASAFVEVPLGRVDLPLTGTLSGLSIEIYVEREAGSGIARLDCIVLYPSDEAVGSLGVPDVASAVTYFAPDHLVPPSDVAGDPTFQAGVLSRDETVVILNDTDEGVSTPTIAASSGRHRVRFFFSKGSGWDGQILFRIVDTFGTPAVVSSSLRAATFQPYVELQYDAVSGHSYRYQGIVSSYVDGFMKAGKITDAFQPFVAASEALLSDPSRYEVEKLDTSGSVAYRAAATGAMPVLAPPGLSVLVHQMTQIGLDGYEDDASPLAQAATDRFYVTPYTFS